MKIVATIPAYNEEKTIGGLVSSIHKVMKRNRYNYRILVVDDGSSDRTAQKARSSNAVVYSHLRNFGLAETFRTETSKSLEMGADVIVHIDADMQYLPEEIPKLVNEIKEGYDLVLGSRFMGKIEYMPWINRIGNIAFSRAISQISQMKISDAQTGFRAFTKDFAKKVVIISDHTYTQEQVIKAARGKYKIKEVGVYFAKRKDKSRLISNPFSYALRAWINILRIYRDYKPLKFFGTMGAWIFAAGFILGIYMVRIHFTTGIYGHFALLMLDVLTLSIGFQIIMFALLADMFEGR